jgi:15,16-dihydrobiliverdin:ferredoxin oxidoreductase
MTTTTILSSQSLLLLAVAASVADGYVSTSGAFLGRQTRASFALPQSAFYMDQHQVIDFTALDDLKRSLAPTLAQAEAVHGMPWKSSIDPKVTDEELLYMPFWEWQLSFMKENLTNLRVESCTNAGTDFSYKENTQKKSRMVNLCASSDEYRKIRLTYYDAGDNTQVFNSVWYPDPAYNLPVLGVDLLAFNRKKYLAIVDFQPLYADEKEHAAPFEHRLKPIKEQYPSSAGKMSSKFYDETQFFSQQMLFSRFEDETVISNELFPAFQSYVKEHLQLIRETTPCRDSRHAVMERQKAYDTYSAERDPATGLFTAMYGEEWAMGFVHDFLFSMSERKATVAPR